LVRDAVNSRLCMPIITVERRAAPPFLVEPVTSRDF